MPRNNNLPPDKKEQATARGAVSDAPPQNWVDTYAPPWSRPWLRLMRADRPIGTWLLLWPCWFSIVLAAPLGEGWRMMPLMILPEPGLLVLFAAGAFVMRGAGCTYNDIVDRHIDAQIARTRSRPIPSGDVSLSGAWVFLLAQGLVGLMILLQLNLFSILLAAASLVPVSIYPFVKRISAWPQVMLGLTFNWGALLGWSAVTGTLSPAALVLYGSCAAWTIGYDTIYAHQDKEDDATLGLGSTAQTFGSRTKTWLYVFYGLAGIGFITTGLLANLNLFYFVALPFALWHLVRQIQRLDIDNPDLCLQLFRSNRDFGALLFAALLVGTVGT